jgi:hypothetical protein
VSRLLHAIISCPAFPEGHQCIFIVFAENFRGGPMFLLVIFGAIAAAV